MFTIQSVEKFNTNLERKIEAVSFEFEHSFIELAFFALKLGKVETEANLTCIIQILHQTFNILKSSLWSLMTAAPASKFM
jgi:hypothetical protein